MSPSDTVIWPKRIATSNGKAAFAPEDEDLILKNVEEHGFTKLEAAVKVGTSLVTLYAILRRAKARKNSAPAIEDGAGPEDFVRSNSTTGSDIAHA